MSHFLNPVEEEQCVFLTYEAEMPFTEAATICQEVWDLLVTERWNRVLVDVTVLQTVPTTAQLLELGRNMPKAVPWGTRVALVIRPDQVRHARAIEVMARKAGIFLTYFMDIAKADAWVQGGQRAARPPQRVRTDNKKGTT